MEIIIHLLRRIAFCIVLPVLIGLQAVSRADTLPSTSGVQLINSGFESGLTGWSLLAGTGSQKLIETSIAHSGRSALEVHVSTDTRPWLPSFDLEQYVPELTPDTWYEMSLWARTTNSVNFVFGVNGYEGQLPMCTAGWTRVAVRFKTNESETRIYLKTASRADDVLIDDVAVTLDSAPVSEVYSPEAEPPAAINRELGFKLDPGAYTVNAYDASEVITGTATLRAASGGQLTILERNQAGQETSLGETTVPPGMSAVSFSLPATLAPRDGSFLIARLDGVQVGGMTVHLMRRDLPDMFPKMIDSERTRLYMLTQQAQLAGLAKNAYVHMGLFIAGRYLDRVQLPDIEKRQTDYWTWVQLREVSYVLDQTQYLLRRPPPDVPPIPTDHPGIDQGVFMAGSPPSPIFYGGYMGIHTDEDIPAFPDMGATAMQMEMGPNALAADGSGGPQAIDRLNHWFDQTNAAKVKVDLLLSPHYFPDWARQEAPDIRSDRHGGIDYIIDHPVVLQAIGQWLKVVGPGVKNQPSLLSFNFANEPDYWYSGKDKYSKPLWAAYLAQHHTSVDSLNTLYGTNYASFDDIPAPPEMADRGKTIGEQRWHYDWVNFNAEHFTNWFRWMSGLLKAGAPEVYTQAKIACDQLDAPSLNLGNDTEAMCGFTDIAGCDGGTGQPGHEVMYSYGWRDSSELRYDLLRSFKDQPVANTEDHIISDGYQPQVSPDYVRSALWQSTLHGLGHTALWEFGDADRGAYGGVKLRPADIYGAGTAWLDARRCAPIVAAIVREKPRIAILYSRNSLYWGQDDYSNDVRAVYTALTFLGEPVTFVSEKQLADGALPPVKAIILCRANSVSDQTVAALQKFAATGGKLIEMGDGSLGYDEYYRPRAATANVRPIQITESGDERIVFRELAPIVNKLGAPESLVNVRDGAHSWGVEYRIVSDHGRTYLSALDLLQTAATVRWISAPSRKAKDLLSGDICDTSRLLLLPMKPVLLEFSEPTAARSRM